MILTETAYAINQNELEGLLALEENLSAVDHNQANSTGKSLVQNDQTAVISINGALFPKPNVFTLLGFGTSLSSIQGQLHNAEISTSIKKIIINFDSPGGSVTGINELANSIKSLQKPTTAYIAGSAQSAAFWLAAACDEIVCDATALVGSIGVIGIFKKNSKDNIEIVSSNATDKRPNVETDEGKAVLLKTIDDLESVFISSIKRLRPKLTEDKIKALRGGVLIGSKAVSAGFSDEIGSLQGLIEGKAAEQHQSIATNAQAVSSDNGWAAAFAKINQGLPQAVKTKRKGLVETDIQSIDKSMINESVSKQARGDEHGWAAAFAKVNQGLPQAVKTKRKGQVETNIQSIDKSPANESVRKQARGDEHGWAAAFAKVNQGLPQAVKTKRKGQVETNIQSINKNAYEQNTG